MGKARLYEGNAPSLDDGWFVLGDVDLPNGEMWVVYARHTGEFVNVKVVAAKPVPNKGNYWFSRHRLGGLVKPRDFAIMKEGRPDLHHGVSQLLETHYG